MEGWKDSIRDLVSEWSLQENSVDLELSDSQLDTIWNIIEKSIMEFKILVSGKVG